MHLIDHDLGRLSDSSKVERSRFNGDRQHRPEGLWRYLQEQARSACVTLEDLQWLARGF